MKKVIKKIALLFPPLKYFYKKLEDIRNRITDTQNQLEELRIQNNYYKENYEIRQNQDNYNLNYKFFYFESMFNEIYDSAVMKKRFCPVCQNEAKIFLPAGEVLRQNAVCPHCGSLERHRSLWLFFENHTDLFSNQKVLFVKRILHFAPENCFSDKFVNLPGIDYYPVDFNPSAVGIRDVIDIQSIAYQDCMFDVIICNHVLEHIPNDQKAMKELYRVLKNDGVAYIGVPLKKELDKTLENPEYNTPELRSKYYGQYDHLRYYGNDFPEKLNQAGFSVSIIEANKDFTEQDLFRYGIYREETIFLCTK